MVAFVASSAMRGDDKVSTPAPAPTAAAPKPHKPKVVKSKPAAAKPAAAKPEVAKAAPSSAAKPAAPKPVKAKPATPAGVPARVEHALERHRTVVLFFYQRGGADDSATASAVAGLRGSRGVSVFTSPVSRLGDFRAVTGNLGLSQAPAVVIVGKKGKASVVEGFVDSQTLAQEVADSR